MTFRVTRPNGFAQRKRKSPFIIPDRPVATRDPTQVMESIEELAKRVNDAAIRFVITEIEMVTSLLSRIDRLTDPKEKTQCIREAREALNCASWSAATIDFPATLGLEVMNRIRHLTERVDELAAMLRKFR